MNNDKLLTKEFTNREIIKNYGHAIDDGILKVMSKMGVSTLAS